MILVVEGCPGRGQDIAPLDSMGYKAGFINSSLLSADRVEVFTPGWSVAVWHTGPVCTQTTLGCREGRGVKEA
jgi:hypothetical protein